MRFVPGWLLVLVVVALVIFLFNALHVISIHGSISI